MGDELDKTSIQLGISTRDLQAWRHAAALSGVSSEQLTTGLAQLYQRQLLASQGSKEAGKTFQDLGVDVKDSSGNLRTLDQLLPDIADAMQRMPEGPQRTALAMRLFGESGRRMVPMLSQGREGVAAMRRELEELGGGASAEFIQRSAAMADSEQRLSVATMGLRSDLASGLLPTLTRGVQALTRVTSAVARSDLAASLARPVMVALGVAGAGAGVAMASAWLPAAAPILAAAVAVSLIYLAIDDLQTTLDGGDSLIRRWLEGWKGTRGATEDINSMRDAVLTLQEAMALIVDSVKYLAGAMAPIADAWNSLNSLDRYTSGQALDEWIGGMIGWEGPSVFAGGTGSAPGSGAAQAPEVPFLDRLMQDYIGAPIAEGMVSANARRRGDAPQVQARGADIAAAENWSTIRAMEQRAAMRTDAAGLPMSVPSWSPRVATSTRPPQRNVTIHQNVTAHVTNNEATDTVAVERAVERGVEQALDRDRRQILDDLEPEGGEE